MAKSTARGIVEVAVTIAVAVVILYLIGFLIDFLDQFSPGLVPYRKFVEDAIAGILAIGVATIIIRIARQVIEEYSRKVKKGRNLRGVYIILRILIYFAAIVWFLYYIGISLEGALVGGAIGGIIVGIAVQSIVTSLFSGIMVSADGLVAPGEPISIYSYLYGQTLTGEVIDVRLLHTILRNVDGQIIRVPNNALLNFTVFTRLRDKGLLKYTFNAVLKEEIPVSVMMEFVKGQALAAGKDHGLKELELQFIKKEAGKNTISIIIRFEGLTNLNRIISDINLSIEKTSLQLMKSRGKELDESEENMEERK